MKPLTEEQKVIARTANKTYAKKMKQITVRIPADQADEILRKAKARAESLGIVSKKGEGSVNGYILALIANDLDIDISTLSERD
jgi:hypothetical protein